MYSSTRAKAKTLTWGKVAEVFRTSAKVELVLRFISNGKHVSVSFAIINFIDFQDFTEIDPELPPSQGFASQTDSIVVQMTDTFKTFNTPFNTAKLQYLFSNTFYCLESISHPVLVSPVWFCLEDLDSSYHPSYLHPLIRSKPLPQFLSSPDQLILDNRQMIALGVLHALLCLHHHDMFHGNINPDNIILDDALLPHLISSGLSRIADVYQTTLWNNCLSSPGGPRWSSEAGRKRCLRIRDTSAGAIFGPSSS
jgi:serine/threonine protein kinase